MIKVCKKCMSVRFERDYRICMQKSPQELPGFGRNAPPLILNPA